MSNAQSSKGNPASRRMSNAHLKEYRAACWRIGQRRKQQRIAAQREREIANRARRKACEPTPWETACALRAKLRQEAGLRRKWEAEQKKNKEQLPAA